MRDRVPAAGSARSILGSVLLSAAFLYITRDLTVPLGVLYAVLLIAGWVICRAHLARVDAERDAGIQQRRADVLTGPRLSLTELLYTGSRDQLVGHHDREQVIERLGERYAEGYLTPHEHEQRTTEATHARTRADLAHTLRDLP
ncbi:DUF1707 domain-containing protein [Actinomadura sp. WMMA1423]|uniref:DUF1707 SHOCT-like domain-containing protein n=1 Tax=Actinomadura sp. WMMA1423 TaxID=2591108 RepID=UPI0011463DF3|nr:DUF1707 domain-containing protein [Actinomadura sp. WMMA1423]